MNGQQNGISPGESPVTLRPYAPEDCQALCTLLINTVHTVNAADYTAEQLYAWTSGVSAASLHRALSAHYSLVAVEQGEIVGFGDIDETGYLDHLYVHHAHQHRGIATALCDALERHVPGAALTTHASITARPFFEKRGYAVVRAQQVSRKGILLSNFVMCKARPR